MTKSVAIGVLLFVAGIVVGRVSVLSTQPQVAAASPSFPNQPVLTVPSAPSAPSAPSMPSAPSAPSDAVPGGVLRGRVAEVIQVPQYTYVRLESGDWAAVSSAPSLAVGATVGINLQTQMTQFSSPSLGRTFDKIWFGMLEGAEPVARQPTTMDAPMGKPPAAPEVKAALKAEIGRAHV